MGHEYTAGWPRTAGFQYWSPRFAGFHWMVGNSILPSSQPLWPHPRERTLMKEVRKERIMLIFDVLIWTRLVWTSFHQPVHIVPTKNNTGLAFGFRWMKQAVSLATWTAPRRPLRPNSCKLSCHQRRGSSIKVFCFWNSEVHIEGGGPTA